MQPEDILAFIIRDTFGIFGGGGLRLRLHVFCSPVMLSRARRKSREEPNGECDKPVTPRSKCWPPSYCDPPPLIVTDYGVCRASTPTNRPAAADDADPGLGERADTAGEDGDEPLCQRTSPVTVTVSAAVDDDDVDDSQRLLTQVDTVPSTDGTVPPLCDA